MKELEIQSIFLINNLNEDLANKEFTCQQYISDRLLIELQIQNIQIEFKTFLTTESQFENEASDPQPGHFLFIDNLYGTTMKYRNQVDLHNNDMDIKVLKYENEILSLNNTVRDLSEQLEVQKNLNEIQQIKRETILEGMKEYALDCIVKNCNQEMNLKVLNDSSLRYACRAEEAEMLIADTAKLLKNEIMAITLARETAILGVYVCIMYTQMLIKKHVLCTIIFTNILD